MQVLFNIDFQSNMEIFYIEVILYIHMSIQFLFTDIIDFIVCMILNAQFSREDLKMNISALNYLKNPGLIPS